MSVDDSELFLVPEVLVQCWVTSVETYGNASVSVVVNPSEVLVVRRDEGHVPVIDEQFSLSVLFSADYIYDRVLLAFL